MIISLNDLRLVAYMAKTVADLDLDDEHMTIGINDSVAEAAGRLLTMPGGIFIVLDDDSKAKGVIGHRQFLKALAANVDASSSKCSEWMEMDFLDVQLSDSLKTVLSEIQKRGPQAVVASDTNGDFAGYFSPNDYQKAESLVRSLKDLKL